MGGGLLSNSIEGETRVTMWLRLCVMMYVCVGAGGALSVGERWEDNRLRREWVTVLRTWASTWTVLPAGTFRTRGSTGEVGTWLVVVGMSGGKSCVEKM